MRPLRAPRAGATVRDLEAAVRAAQGVAQEAASHKTGAKVRGMDLQLFHMLVLEEQPEQFGGVAVE